MRMNWHKTFVNAHRCIHAVIYIYMYNVQCYHGALCYHMLLSVPYHRALCYHMLLSWWIRLLSNVFIYHHL